jgi:hypothetical protein
MNKGYLFPVSKFFIAALVILFGAVVALGETSLEDLIAQEESGIVQSGIPEPAASSMPSQDQIPVLDSIPQDSVLLIPDSDTLQNLGMYDPYDGTFLGILFTDTGHLTTPKCAIEGPDGNIYLSEQVNDGVYVYDTSGTYLYTYCDGTDGLDNLRGIDFRNDTLFVTCGGTLDLVAMFDAPHNRLADFISDGREPYDIHFLPDGRALIADITGDNIRLYNADGTFSGEIIDTDFPIQVTSDDLTPGGFLCTSLLDREITDFDLDGTIQQITSLSTFGRGVYRLGNGNLLASIADGIYELEPGTGNVLDTENTGNGFQMIHLFVLEGGTAPSGRCCYNGNTDCVDTTEAGCTSLGGNWDAGLNCIDDPCPTGGDCDYVPGDVNGSDSYNGLDITYGVNYFKGGSEPLCPNGSCPIPPCDAFFYCGDVNGSCSYNGLDITYGVAFFKGGSSPIPCADCPPAP